MKRPKKNEYAPFFETYVSKVPPKGSINGLLKKTWKSAQELFGTLPEEKGDFAYAEGKWTTKQMLIHLIDSERVFAFRALWCMRGDRAALTGFNQDHWMEQADVSGRTIRDLIREWKSVRENTIALAKNCSPEQEKFLGTASGWQTATRSWFFIIVGHQLHHEQVFREKYLS